MRALMTAACLTVLVSGAAMAADKMQDARDILAREAKDSGRPEYTETNAVQFPAEDNVYVKSALALNLTFREASVTLPLYRGLSPKGEAVYYIITDSSDFEVAKALGINYAPKLRKVADSAGAQEVRENDGVVQFKGDVDFSPKYIVKPGARPNPFPPSVAEPGAVADSEWSSIIVFPSGLVLNAQMMQNAAGSHDRVKAIDPVKRTVTLSILDGVQGGKPYFYHLVTDVSEKLPSVLEKGVWAPRLGALPAYGKSTPGDASGLLAFSPVVNGPLDPSNRQEQGFAASLANGGIDPVNVFPLGPDNDNASEENNYSPLWDAHISMWTKEAVASGKVRRITSVDDLKQLVAAGDVTSAMTNPPGPGNDFLGGLRPSKAIVNCPVIAHPLNVH